MTILEAHNITKSFGSAKVLNRVSLSLEEGESLAIIGPSGGGKSTLLRCLNFLERMDTGRISVRGEVLYDSEVPGSEDGLREKRLHFGLVFQSFHLFPQYTALKNITLARELLVKKQPSYKDRKTELLEQIRSDGLALLEQVGLSAKKDAYPHELSGGQQQRVAIARALALNPDILCFDEPTSALDPELTGEVLRVIRSLAEKNTTMIIVTHEMQFARQVADKVVFLDDGAVLEYGVPQEVFEPPLSERMQRFLSHYTDQNL
jgi:polar amino acid transport system ATP-binding protein